LEPAGYISHLNKDPFNGNPIHNVIIEFALGDAQVTWLAGQNIGRTLGCYMYNSEIYVEKYYSANIRGLLTYPA